MSPNNNILARKHINVWDHSLQVYQCLCANREQWDFPQNTYCSSVCMYVWLSCELPTTIYACCVNPPYMNQSNQRYRLHRLYDTDA